MFFWKILNININIKILILKDHVTLNTGVMTDEYSPLSLQK